MTGPAPRLAAPLRLGTIRARLLAAFVGVVLLPVVVLMCTSAVVGLRSGYGQVIEQLDSVAALKEAEIERWVSDVQLSLGVAAGGDAGSAELMTLLRTSSSEAAARATRRALAERFARTVRESLVLEEIFLLDRRGNVVLSTRPAAEGEFRGLQPYFRGGLEGAGVHVQTLGFSSTSEGINTIVAVRPVLDAGGYPAGVLACRAGRATLDAILRERAGLGNTGETYLVGSNSVLLTEARFGGYEPGKTYVHSLGARRAIVEHAAGSGTYDDYRGESVLGVYRWLPGLQVALLAEQDRHEALQSFRTTLGIHLAVALCALVIAVALSVLVSRGIATPVTNLARTASQIAAGNLELTAPVEGTDEVGTLAQDFNRMTARLRTLIAGLEQRVGDLDRAGQALRESEARYRRIVDTATEGVWLLGRDARTVFVNARMAEILGRRVDEVIGRPVTDFMLEEDTADHLRRIENRRRGIAESYRRRFRRSDGQTVWTHVSATPVLDEAGGFDGALAMLADITEQRRAEQEVALLGFALDNVREAAFLIDEGGRFRFVNEEACRVLGYARDALLGLGVPDIDPEFPTGRWPDHWRELRERRSLVFEGRHRARDGRLLPVEINANYFEYDGRGYDLALVRDITDRRRAQEEIRALNQELERRVADRTARLEAANRELEAFAQSVSHDLRAPLRHIASFAELLQQRIGPGLDEAPRHHLEAIAGSARSMGAIIEDLLSFARMGRSEAVRAVVDLGALVRELVGELAVEAAGRTVEWKIGELPPVFADRQMLKLALGNLLSNALKFTRTRARAEIEVGHAAPAGPEVVVFVRDNGVGFEMRYAHKLFEAFQRLHRAEDFEGTGLGLANVRRIVERHGGRAWAEGAVDGGATFYLSLPPGDAGAAVG